MIEFLVCIMRKLPCVMFKKEIINLIGTTRIIDAWMPFVCVNRDDGVLYLIFTLTFYFAIIGANVFAIPTAYKLPTSQMHSDP